MTRPLGDLFLPRGWMGATESFDAADWVIVGLPYDGTCSFRPGTRFGPDAIRRASIGIETYAPEQQRDLESVCYYDAGDLAFPFGDRDEVLRRIGACAEEVLNAGKRWFGMGGEHLVTLPVVQAYAKRYPDLMVVQFDAHADLRDDYLGDRLSHATVMRRISELPGFGPDRLIQIGIRSGIREEFDWMTAHGTGVSASGAGSAEAMADVRQRLGDRPVFWTVDLDVFDPAVLPGTGTPEPGGIDWPMFSAWVTALQGIHCVGADVVELSPPLDASGRSAVLAAKVMRSMLLSG